MIYLNPILMLGFLTVIDSCLNFYSYDFLDLKAQNSKDHSTNLVILAVFNHKLRVSSRLFEVRFTFLDSKDY